MARNQDLLQGFEKVKTVGKGSFGTASLYKRKEDNLLVVAKEIYLTDMSQVEKKLSLNEVQVLAALNHKNIIRYLGSFEKEGLLMILMEYANGGNLAQLINYKKDKEETFTEPQVLDIFSQLCAGMSYMHANKILHRDMKSANIFMNKDGTIKIGDFGISKMMDTRSQAQTVVGTPYYLSPEMCEGKDYNEKSDIWAMGCILYELTCLRKPFEAPSLPILVQNITSCNYPPIPEWYSNGLYQLIEMILQKDPDKRPSAKYMYETIIPAIYENLEDGPQARRFSLTSIFNKTIPRERSVLYELYGFTVNADMFPVRLPHNKILDFSNSETHFIVITADRKIYTWGDGTSGQLAHGYADVFKKYPMHVDFLRGKNVVRCFAGNGYSIFLNDNGTILTCGDGKYGCLGHGDWCNVYKPKIVESLIHTSIMDISCGSRHVLALASNGKVYSWGSAHEGQLGLGHSQYCCRPMPVKLSNEYNIGRVYAGVNASAVLTTTGKVLCCGNNNYCKLGFQSIDYLKTFLMLTEFPEKVKDISLGQTHTVLLAQNGTVYCLGNNTEGQCGPGKIINGLYYKVDDLKAVDRINAGTCYTVGATEDNVIYFWGTHYKSLDKNKNESTSSSSNKSNSELLPKKDINESKFFQQKYAVSPEPETFVPVFESQPKPVLALYASPKNIQAGNLVWLAGISANDNSITVLVHTTAPPPVKKVQQVIDDDELDNQSQLLDPHWIGSRHKSNKDISLPNTPQMT